MRWLDKLKQGLKRTATKLNLTSLDTENLEEALILTDIGIETAEKLVESVQNKKPSTVQEMRFILKEELMKKMTPVEKQIHLPASKPAVFLMIGVNGAGKTTTIAKLARRYLSAGKSVACVAGDTFRAGAVAQLQQWTEKIGADFYAPRQGADAAGFIFDSLKKVIEKGTDVVFIDTAGRLQNRTDLMAELKKIVRVIQKIDDTFPHETILVLDATVGQNALSQVKVFQETCPITGLVMTKLDGTAKGGVLVALADTFHLPIYAIGVGEQMDDLDAFLAEEYVVSLLGDE